MQKALKLLLGMVAGAAVGYGGAMLIIGLTGDRGSTAAPSSAIEWGKLALAVGVTALSMGLAVCVHLILHEAGHLLAGLLTGYRFVSFRIFKYTLVQTSEGLRWKRFHIAGTGGQCILELPEGQDPEHAPWFWYNAGGVLANLAVMALSIGVLRSTEPGLVPFALLVVLAFVGLIMALMNGVPVVVGGVSNDGYNIWLLWRHPADRRFFVHSLQAAGQMSRGKRLCELPAEWIEDCPVTAQSNPLQLSARTLYMELLEELGRYDEARQVAEEILRLDRKLPQLFRMEVGGDCVMLELMTTGRREVVEELWTKPLARYTEAGSKYAPIKCAVLYAYERLYNHDADRAETYRRQLEVHASDYTMPGEVATARQLIAAATQASPRRP